MEFLMDKRVIDYPYLFRKILVGGIIVPFRAPKSAEAYKTIWTSEGSPLIVLTKKLKDALQLKCPEPVEIAMRYGKPSMETAFENLLKQKPDLSEIIAVPLYPHYAMSSYETAVEHAREVYATNQYSFDLKFVKPYYNEDHYIKRAVKGDGALIWNPNSTISFSVITAYPAGISGNPILRAITAWQL